MFIKRKKFYLTTDCLSHTLVLIRTRYIDSLKKNPLDPKPSGFTRSGYLSMIQGKSYDLSEKIMIEMTDVVKDCKCSTEYMQYRDEGPRESCLKEH